MLHKEYSEALRGLADAFLRVSELAERDAEFRDEVLSGKLGRCWGMSIDEIWSEVRGAADEMVK